MHQNAPGRPACPTWTRKHAHAHTHGMRAWRPPTRKGRCRRPHETAPVHRPRPPLKDGRYGKPDPSVTGSTHAHHGSARSPRRTPEGPARDNPITGPRTGTTWSEPTAAPSAAATSRHKEPGSRPASTCPAQPPSKSGGVSPRPEERHHGVGKADKSAESDRTGRGAAHQHGATRQGREARRRPQPRHRDRCEATTATGCCKPGQRAQPAMNHGTGTGARRHPTHKPHAGQKPSAHTNAHTHPSQEPRGAAKTRAQTHAPTEHTPATSGGVQAERGHKHTHTPTPQPGVAGRSPNGAPGHTPTLQTPARSGGVQVKCAHKHTRTPIPEPGVAGCSQNPSPSTHIRTAHPSQEWRGTPERGYKHTDTPAPQPGVAGRSRNPRQSAHTYTANPSKEWRGTSGARTQTHTHPNT